MKSALIIATLFAFTAANEIFSPEVIGPIMATFPAWQDASTEEILATSQQLLSCFEQGNKIWSLIKIVSDDQ